MGVFAFSIHEIVNASNQPFVSAMLIAFVIGITMPKVNVVLAKSMACSQVMPKVRMLFDLSVVPGKFEFQIRPNLLT